MASRAARKRDQGDVAARIHDLEVTPRNRLHVLEDDMRRIRPLCLV